MGKWRKLDFADYDPTRKAPVIFGDPDGDVLLTEGDLTEIGGELGAGKSFLQIALALCAAFGRPFMGFECRIPNAKVTYVPADGDGYYPVQHRVARVALGMGITLEELAACERLQIFVPEATFCLDNEADESLLRRHLLDFDPDLLIIESLATLMAADDRNGLGPTAAFIGKKIRPLHVRPGGRRRAIVLAVHFNKTAKKNAALKDRVSGSFYVVAGADAAIGLEITGPESFNVSPLKRSRWGTTFAAFNCELQGKRGEPIVFFRGPVQKLSKSGKETWSLPDRVALELTRAKADPKDRKAAFRAVIQAGFSFKSADDSTFKRGWDKYRGQGSNEPNEPDPRPESREGSGLSPLGESPDPEPGGLEPKRRGRRGLKAVSSQADSQTERG